MPPFDVVSEVDMHEVANAVDETNREIANRYDFKGTNARVEREETYSPCTHRPRSSLSR